MQNKLDGSWALCASRLVVCQQWWGGRGLLRGEGLSGKEGQKQSERVALLVRLRIQSSCITQGMVRQEHEYVWSCA